MYIYLCTFCLGTILRDETAMQQALYLYVFIYKFIYICMYIYAPFVKSQRCVMGQTYQMLRIYMYIYINIHVHMYIYALLDSKVRDGTAMQEALLLGVGILKSRLLQVCV